MSLTVLLAVAFVGAALYYVCPLRLRWVLLLLPVWQWVCIKIFQRRARTFGDCV